MPDSTPFERLGGAATIRRVANRFYDLLETAPEYAELRAMHGADLGPIRESLASFLAAWSGGPRDWFASRPGTCIMSMHRALPITRDLAHQWSEAMVRALAEDPAIGPDLGRQLAQALVRMAYAMVSIEEPAAA